MKDMTRVALRHIAKRTDEKRREILLEKGETIDGLKLFLIEMENVCYDALAGHFSPDPRAYPPPPGNVGRGSKGGIKY